MSELNGGLEAGDLAAHMDTTDDLVATSDDLVPTLDVRKTRYFPLNISY